MCDPSSFFQVHTLGISIYEENCYAHDIHQSDDWEHWHPGCGDLNQVAR